MVELQPSKLAMPVRSRSPARYKHAGGGTFRLASHGGRFTSGSYELRLPFPLTATPCRRDEDTVGSARRKSADTQPVAIAASPAKATVLATPAQRRTRASLRPDSGQLSLLDPAPVDCRAGDVDPSR